MTRAPGPDPAPELRQRSCRPCRKGDPRIGADEAERLHVQVPQWRMDPAQGTLEREFSGLASYAAGLALLNAIAGLAEEEDHHPDLWLGYKTLRVSWRTHAVGGLSWNDFICAAKVDALAERQG